MLTARITSTREAAKIIRAGGIVAFPTETVFGLGVDATNRLAVEKLFVAKGRPSDNPLIVHVGKMADCAKATSDLTPIAEALLATFSPGPLTVVLPKQASISTLVTAGLDTVGLRIPDHRVAAEILLRTQVPVAAPSANLSGRPSCTTWESVLEDLDGRIDAVYCDNSQGLGIESTVVDCCGPFPVVLRPGAVTIEQIRQVLPEARELARVPGDGDTVNGVKSPGLLHPHYQPQAAVQLVAVPRATSASDGQRVAYCGMQGPTSEEGLSLIAVYDTVDDYAASFYEFLREADRQLVQTILVQKAPNEGIGRALLDRQRRAAGK